MNPANRDALIRELAARVSAAVEAGGDAQRIAFDEVFNAGLAPEVLDLLDRQAQAYADHADALKRERRDKIVRAVQ